MNQLQVGKLAPDFELPAAEGRISLSDFLGKKHVVLYFYPLDDTPGCTKEACGFRDLQGEFESLDTVISGVSTDSIESHQEFAAKYQLKFSLLSDETMEACRLYGVWKQLTWQGVTFWGIERSTFIIDKSGEFRYIENKVKVDGHTEKILEIVKTL